MVVLLFWLGGLYVETHGVPSCLEPGTILFKSRLVNAAKLREVLA